MFYRDGLGHELIWRDDSAAGLRLPDSDAELVLHTDERPMETDLLVASVPAAIGRFVEAGGKVVAGPFDIRIGLCAMIEDPWQNRLVILDSSKASGPHFENIEEGPSCLSSTLAFRNFKNRVA